MTGVQTCALPICTVTLGGGDGTYVEITSGLSEGETVLVPAQSGMDAGAAGGGGVVVY